ncbi:hypothetical protein LFZ18_11340 [Salmonella enterica subsp. enterica serovar Itami str. SA20014991]|nr:hypothetical protein A8179_14320 [Salmonella enterica subsp. enterica serovar Newport]AVU71766.1 hypothetical protein FORC58_2819 [Salmonella enterica subsp. enterica serovar Typhimurium]KFT85583.1 hypothetical protein SEEB0208_00705 [Salmonella enterica subsp. enterica serovar Bareilly str. CFSAN000208]KFT87964.1 hypothetical protein SEEB0204_20720 [Salmonella enterica subsp. enterica serovar Bareilly str. CFSAN000204]KFU00763.1 hypothetical protein SEEB0201_18970 [Salmonella enterica subsp
MIVNLYQDNYSGYRQHGVSGVGGSNPLVPTKIPLKNQPVRAVFFMAQFPTGKLWGETGE